MKVQRLLMQFIGSNIHHTPREANHLAHDEAQKVLEEDQIEAKIEGPLYKYREYQAEVRDVVVIV